jgi:hypothetical protein
VIAELYRLLGVLRAGDLGTISLEDSAALRGLPDEGLYFFFEPGEVRADGSDRVVRVGTHGLRKADPGGLTRRLRQHRGTGRGRAPGAGNHRASVFRRHLGTALLSAQDDELLAAWTAKRPTPERRVDELRVEREVSERVRRMQVLVLPVGTRPDGTSDRGRLESSAIAVLARHDEPASAGWLGRFARAEAVRTSSLWNVDHVDDPVDPVDLELLASYVERA